MVSRNATFPFKASQQSIQEIARQLGVNYVLQGSLRQAGERIRVTATLEDARSAKTIWSNRFDRTLADAFTVQDELTDEIVTALDVELVGGEQARHRRSRIPNPVAGQILYKGLTRTLASRLLETYNMITSLSPNGPGIASGSGQFPTYESAE